MEQLQDAYAIAKYIKDAVKKTPGKLYAQGNFESITIPDEVDVFGEDGFRILIGEVTILNKFIEDHKDVLTSTHLEIDRRNSALPLLDISKIDARIEPGAIIRTHVTIGSQAVIMMGAVINIGAVVGEKTMIDMNAVLGARATIGKNCHIGAGAVVAGVLEPPSKDPVIIEDDVLVGANAVILEGVRIGTGAVVAAGSIVTQDVAANSVVAGSPARVIKQKDDKTISKTQILEDLR
ncbi:2,3,4,5-tetrahydropyridine-2,6-dicarboxylate N-acetyltransferase [Mycoplasmatota bacterium]|nr:2,3,4,5-tetrahydropyridine-2,6-dicarboxylate N-acetyltransferase [Mycoplasmatota bacterium]